ncbi:MAG: hydantoinase B/oxoprolinase family protein [Actinobacteria bacterium]|nr:hydantoinase B/oxoprolinase family protein [Actinomycetota bacterium]
MPSSAEITDQALCINRTLPRRLREAGDVDPITTEIIRNGLLSAAEQMKRTVVRTAFSPLIYETLDFAISIYDAQARLIAQAPTLHFFMGILGSSVEAAVEAVGVDTLAPGDIILFNVPYNSGSHPQDAALIMPVFDEGQETPVGYVAIMEHWLDIGAKDPYCTDTVDVFQEGTKFPGVKLYEAGVRNDAVQRIILANTRVPNILEPEINAQVAALRAGADAFRRVVERYGAETFLCAVEKILDHGEAVVREYMERIPDGTYVGKGMLDDNGVDDDLLPFEIEVRVDGSAVTVDYRNAPNAQPTPINSSLPATLCVSRVALAMLAGNAEPPNDGHFRPIEVVTRPGSLFHATPPSPCFLGWGGIQSFEVIFEAMAAAMPGSVPAWSGADILSFVWWGAREGTGEAWADGCALPIGHGGSANGDGKSCVMHASESAVSFPPIEVWEVKDPWTVESFELAPDSAGAGRFRGGLGFDLGLRSTEDHWVTVVVERTKTGAAGLEGGTEGRPNFASLTLPDGTTRSLSKDARVLIPRGALLTIRSGGGGGYGRPADRSLEAIAEDLANGYITTEFADTHYPQWSSDEPSQASAAPVHARS